jgi:hypothetical protein
MTTGKNNIISDFYGGSEDNPCYNCLYQDNGEEQVNCATHERVSPIVGSINSSLRLKRNTKCGTCG